MKNPYSVLGVSKNATDEEVKNAYHELARKYHPDNYPDDNPLKELASEKMQEINEAYEKIQKMRAGGGSEKNGNGQQSSGSGNGIYAEIRRKISDRRFTDAERMLFNVPDGERTAEWHYLVSVVLMSKNRQIDAMRELEIACSMDPSNMEYQRFKEMFNNTTRGYGSTYYNPYAGGGQYRQRTSADDACDCCTNLICLDCLCECMGGDLIRCI